MTLEDHVNVHYQPTGARSTEIWHALGDGEAWTVPGSGSLFLQVCPGVVTKGISPSTSSEYAKVVISTVSAADAIDGCGPAPSPPPPSPPAPPALWEVTSATPEDS